MFKVLIILYSLGICMVFFPSQTIAYITSNDSYNLQLKHLPILPFQPPATIIPIPALEETPQGTTESHKPLGTSPASTGISPDSIGITISDLLIDYGAISPTDPVIRTQTIRVLPGSANGFSVFTYTNQELTSSSNSFIPDTSCDNGLCNHTIAAPWTSLLTYGFGYRCDSNLILCDTAFNKDNAYKRFSNKKNGEDFSLLLENDSYIKQQEATITYKVNVSATQIKESYSNVITFLAVPNL